MASKQNTHHDEWQRFPAKTNKLFPFMSTIPCSLVSDIQEMSADTPIKLITCRHRSDRLLTPQSDDSQHISDNRYAYSKGSSGRRSSNRVLNPEQLADENVRLKEELQEAQRLLSRQTLQSKQFTHKLRLRDLEDELSRLELTSAKKHSMTKLTREVQSLKAANQELTAKNDELTRSLSSCRMLLVEAQDKLRRKKQLIRSKDDQLRRYVMMVEELKTEYRPKNRERHAETVADKERQKDKDHVRKHHREQSGSKQLHNSNGQLNRNECSTRIGELTTNERHQTNRQESVNKLMLKSLAPAGQLSRLWSGTLAKTTRNTSRIK